MKGTLSQFPDTMRIASPRWLPTGSTQMSVVVHFVDGKTKEYSRADAADLQDPLFRVSMWTSKRRKLEDIAVLKADTVTLAEVFDRHGNLEHLIAGRGKRGE